MDRHSIEALLNEVRDGHTPVSEALDRLRDLPFEDIGFAKVDHHRALRTGMPEVIFAAGKTAAQVAAIFAHMPGTAATSSPRALAKCLMPFIAVEPRAEFHETARAITLTQKL
jgi:pyridinium-3,5-biscarboxylic acid mononucleotide synthase